MQTEQIALMPMQIASQMIMRGASGAVPAVAGVAALAIGGTILALVKGSKAVSSNIGKIKAGENKASKFTKTDEVIQALTIDNRLFDKFSEQAKALGVGFAACKGESTTNIIFPKSKENVVDMITKSLDAELEKIKALDVEADKTKSDSGLISTNNPQPKLEKSDFEGSEIEKIINSELDKFMQQLSPVLERIEKNQNKILLHFNPENKDKILEQVGRINNTQEIKFSKGKATELTKMISEISNTLRRSIQNSQRNIPPEARNKVLITELNRELKKNGVDVTVFFEGEKFNIKFDPKNKNKIMSKAKEYNKNITLGKQQDNVLANNKSKANDKPIENPLTR